MCVIIFENFFKKNFKKKNILLVKAESSGQSIHANLLCFIKALLNTRDSTQARRHSALWYLSCWPLGSSLEQDVGPWTDLHSGP